MEVLGKSYIVEHCIAFFHTEADKLAYTIYVTDALKMIAENTAKQYGGTAPAYRFADRYKKPETRTAEEIITKMRKKLNGHF